MKPTELKACNMTDLERYVVSPGISILEALPHQNRWHSNLVYIC